MAPVRDELRARAQEGVFLLDVDFIIWLNENLAAKIDGSDRTQFRDVPVWKTFINELEQACAPDELTVFGVGAWIIGQLYWSHLSSFGLLTSVLLVDAMAFRESGERFEVASDHLGTFLDHLSSAGPPCFDAESLRGFVPKLLKQGRAAL